MPCGSRDAYGHMRNQASWAAQVLQTLLPFLRDSTAANMALSAGISPVVKAITMLQNAIAGLA